MSAIEFTAEAIERFELPRARYLSPLDPIDRIQSAVVHHFRLKKWDIVGDDRHKTPSLARHVAMYLCRRRTRASFPELGRVFGNRDHTTVMMAVRKIEDRLVDDEELRDRVAAIEAELDQWGRT